MPAAQNLYRQYGLCTTPLSASAALLAQKLFLTPSQPPRTVSSLTCTNLPSEAQVWPAALPSMIAHSQLEPAKCGISVTSSLSCTIAHS